MQELTRGSDVEDAGFPLAADLVVGEAEDGTVVRGRGGREGEDGARSVRDEVGPGRKEIDGRRREISRRVEGGGGVKAPVELEIRWVSHDIAHQNDRVCYAHTELPRFANGAQWRICNGRNNIYNNYDYKSSR